MHSLAKINEQRRGGADLDQMINKLLKTPVPS
jgi:hypothetical protein